MSRRHTNAEIRAGIAALEAHGWSINTDGTITRTQMQVKKITHDPRTNTEPRYHVLLGSRQATIKRSDLVTAQFGLAAAKERPDAQGVDLRLDLEPETRTRPAGCGPCGHCGGFMARIGHPGDPDEWKCVQCGRANTPPRVLSAEELGAFRRHVHSA